VIKYLAVGWNYAVKLEVAKSDCWFGGLLNWQEEGGLGISTFRRPEGIWNRDARSYTPLGRAAIVVGIYRVDRITPATGKRFKDIRRPRILPWTNIDIRDKRSYTCMWRLATPTSTIAFSFISFIVTYQWSSLWKSSKNVLSTCLEWSASFHGWQLPTVSALI
jgi:hypothetical protein